MWPYFCQVKRGDAIGVCLLFRHDLHTNSPSGRVAVGYCVEKIALRVVRVFAAHFVGLLAREILDALLRLEMPFHIEQFILRIDQAEGMAAIPIHVAGAMGGATGGDK